MARPNTFRPNAGQPNGGVSLTPRAEPNLFAPNELEPNGPESPSTLFALTLAVADQMPAWSDAQALMMDAQWLEGLSDIITLSDAQPQVVLGLTKVLSDSQAGNWADSFSVRGWVAYQYALEILQSVLEGELQDDQSGNWSDAISVALLNPATPINLALSDDLNSAPWQDAFSLFKRDVLYLALSDSLTWQDSISTYLLGLYKLAFADDLNAAPWQDALTFRTNPALVLSDTLSLSDSFAWDFSRAELHLSDAMPTWLDDVYLSFNLGGLLVDQFGVEVVYQNPRSPVRLDQNPLDVLTKERGPVRLDQMVLEIVFGRKVSVPQASSGPQPGLIWGPLARRRGRNYGHTKG